MLLHQIFTLFSTFLIYLTVTYEPQVPLPSPHFIADLFSYTNNQNNNINEEVDITYPIALAGMPNGKVALGIIGINKDQTNDKLKLHIDEISRTATQFRLGINGDDGDDLFRIDISYMVAGPAFPTTLFLAVTQTYVIFV